MIYIIVNLILLFKNYDILLTVRLAIYYNVYNCTLGPHFVIFYNLEAENHDDIIYKRTHTKIKDQHTPFLISGVMIYTSISNKQLYFH